MLKQICTYLLLLVLFTQHLGYFIAYNKFISHHDCNNGASCSKASKAIVCCNGICATKIELDELSKNQTDKKNWKGIEKEIVFTDDFFTTFTFKPFYKTITSKIIFTNNHQLIDKYISSIYKPPCC